MSERDFSSSSPQGLPPCPLSRPLNLRLPMKEPPPVDVEDLARCLWTVGDVTRLAILQRLPDNPDCQTGRNVSQLAEDLGLSQSTISNHLARLRTLGIIRQTRKCRDIYYWIDPKRAESIERQLSQALKLRRELATDPGK